MPNQHTHVRLRESTTAALRRAFPWTSPWAVALALGASLSSCGSGGAEALVGDGEGGSPNHVEDGRGFFRDATFGNDGFWTQAAQLPQGLVEADFTTKDALSAGLQVDQVVLDPAETAAIRPASETTPIEPSTPSMGGARLRRRPAVTIVTAARVVKRIEAVRKAKATSTHRP